MNIAIIGFGNLGGALAQGLLKSGEPAEHICVCDAAEDKRSLARGKYGLRAAGDFSEAAADAETIFLTVKSYVFEELVKSLDRSRLAGKTLVSFMAGVGLPQLRDMLGGGVTLVRGMPSLAISVCDGVIGYTAAPAPVAALLHRLGYAFEAAPEDIEKVMAFSSCGLGFAAYLIDAFSEAGRTMGFAPEVCEKIAAQTFRNALDRGDWKNTVKAVATPGGATEQGVLHLDAMRVSEAVREAVGRAYDRMKPQAV